MNFNIYISVTWDTIETLKIEIFKNLIWYFIGFLGNFSILKLLINQCWDLPFTFFFVTMYIVFCFFHYQEYLIWRVLSGHRIQSLFLFLSPQVFDNCYLHELMWLWYDNKLPIILTFITFLTNTPFSLLWRELPQSVYTFLQ